MNGLLLRLDRPHPKSLSLRRGTLIPAPFSLGRRVGDEGRFIPAFSNAYSTLDIAPCDSLERYQYDNYLVK
ncbi:MAG: hypothetical protein QNJ46_32490 [Leptolyngbyaceae cyanobacterium MO_188.B28]|nr:hypothetical protein [Leptolyngbyaceae cyanobacterium MO_188.B28]